MKTLGAIHKKDSIVNGADGSFKQKLLNYFCLINIIAGLGIIFVQHKYFGVPEYIVIGIVVVVSAIIHICGRKKENPSLQTIMAALYFLCSMFIIVSGRVDTTSMFWICILPVGIFLIARMRVGVIFNALILICILLCFWTPLKPHQVDYPKSIRIIFPLIFLVLSFLGVATELIRSRTLKAFHSANESLKMMATKDSLTGLSNLHDFVERTETILFEQIEQQYAICSMRLKGGTLLNDLYGFEYFNDVLKHIARCLEFVVEKNELVARDSSSMFVLLLQYETRANLSERLESISKLIIEKVGRLSIKIAIGVYEIDNPGIDIYKMYHNALLAQNHVVVKENYGCVFYDDSMRRRVELVAEIEDNMKSALKNGDFVVYYQPKYDIKQQKYTAAEALVRWKYLDGTVLSPYYFIPVFESNQFIIAMDYYIFEQVCMDIRKWLDEGKEPPVISVNMSRLHINDDNFTQKLCEISNKYQIPKKYLEIEITESALVKEENKIISILYDCKDKGFSISMDDFGSGYSSLQALFSLPINTLKLDRTLFGTIDNSKNKDVVSGIIEICKRLNIETVAEGIENKEWVNILQEVGCDYIQGYYYAKPAPVEEFERMVFDTQNNS